VRHSPVPVLVVPARDEREKIWCRIECGER